MALPSDIDLPALPELERYLAGFDAQPTVVLDWTGVDYCCVGGITLVIQAARRHQLAGGSLRITNACGIIARLLEVLDAAELVAPTSVAQHEILR